MFWKKSKEVEPDVSIKFFGADLVVDINKNVTPQQYVKFITGILSDSNLPRAIAKLEMNGHTNAYEKIQEQLVENYMDFTNKLSNLFNLPKKDQEVIKPSCGIMNHE